MNSLGSRQLVCALLTIAIVFSVSLSALSITHGISSDGGSPPSQDQRVVISSETGDLPTHLHLSWVNDPQRAITVMWQTVNDSSSSTVRYSVDGSYSLTATGTHSKPSWASGYIHTVNITHLSPDTTYNYVAGDAVAGWSSPHTFKTAPGMSKSFSFLVLGDSRNPSATNPNYSGWDLVSGAASTVPSDFILAVGDDAYDARNQSLWDAWFPFLERVAADRPYMQTPGNHEYYNLTLWQNYVGQFSFPGNEHYYSFNYSSFHIVVLDNGNRWATPIEVGTPQYNWLVSDLQSASADQKHPWKIVMFHEPPFNSLGSDTVARSAWSPLFDQYHVDLVISGHRHSYERTYPINATGVVKDVGTDGYHWATPPGTIYVTDACGGESLFPLAAPQSWTICQDKQWGFSEFRFFEENNSLQMIHYNTTKAVVDSFWIEKELNESHNPIVISGDADFALKAASEKWSGLGTTADPYIIANYDINSSSLSGIRISNTKVHFTISDITAHSSSHGYVGIRLCNVANGRIENSVMTGNQYGIYIVDSNHIEISDCAVSSSSSNGIYLKSCKNMLIEGCQILNNGNNGIQILSCIDTAIASSNSSSNGWSGIYSSLTGNISVTGGHYLSNLMNGIYLVKSPDADISGAAFSDNSQRGIYLINCNDTMLVGCKVNSNHQHGIHLSSCLNINLSGSDISSNLWDGIYARLCGNTTVNSCWTNYSGMYGIYLSGCSGTTVSGGGAANNVRSGVTLASSNNVLITGSTATDNNGYGIYNIGSTAVTVTGCILTGNRYGPMN